MKQYAIHSVEYTKNGEKKIASPGSVFDVDDTTAGKLKKLGASRDLTQDEMDLESFRNGKVKKAASDEDAKTAKNDDDDKSAENDKSGKPASSEKKTGGSAKRSKPNDDDI